MPEVFTKIMYSIVSSKHDAVTRHLQDLQNSSHVRHPIGVPYLKRREVCELEGWVCVKQYEHIDVKVDTG